MGVLIAVTPQVGGLKTVAVAPELMVALGLSLPLLRAAVAGGGAYVAGRSMGRRAEQRDQAEEDQD
jgi:hypothetical protein